MFTTATLVIGAFKTDLALTATDWRPGQDRERINVLGDGWDKDYVTFFRNAADNELTRRDYTRTGDWTYNADKDVHVAAIATGAKTAVADADRDAR
jgi:hypothetical protein